VFGCFAEPAFCGAGSEEGFFRRQGALGFEVNTCSRFRGPKEKRKKKPGLNGRGGKGVPGSQHLGKKKKKGNARQLSRPAQPGGTSQLNQLCGHSERNVAEVVTAEGFPPPQYAETRRQDGKAGREQGLRLVRRQAKSRTGLWVASGAT
jgi:hypothetical protein